MVAALGAVWVAMPAFAAGVTASFVKTSDWGSGWEGKYTITNGGGSTVDGWTVAFDLPAGTTLGSYWDALLTSSGQRHTFTNRSWNGRLAPGASVSFGFLGAGPGSPTNCQLNGTACGGGTSPTTAPPTTAPPTTAPPTTPPADHPAPDDPPPNTGLPKHILTGYWHNFDNPAVELRLRDVPAEYDLVAVAFADATATPGAVTFSRRPRPVHRARRLHRRRTSRPTCGTLHVARQEGDPLGRRRERPGRRSTTPPPRPTSPTASTR